MISVNLIPGARIVTVRRAACLRAWIAGLAVYAVLLGVFVVGMTMTSSNGSALAAEIVSAERELARLSALEQTTRRELAIVLTELQANQAVGTQPDWSLLLALLSNSLGEDILLRSVRVSPSMGPPLVSVGGAGPDRAVSAEIRAYARSQKAASRFAVALEETGLFSRVSLIDTRRESYSGEMIMTIRIECIFDLSDPAEGQAP